MSVEKDKEALTRQYLLGTLSSQDTARLEETFFSDDEMFEEIEISEDDLVDAYVSNQLSPIEREQFEKRLLIVPRVAERIEFAKILNGATQLPLESSAVHPVRDSPKPSFWDSIVAFWSSRQRLGVGAAAVVLLIAVSVLFFDWLRLREESRRFAFERAELQRKNEELISRTDAEQRRLNEEVKNRDEANAKLQQELENLHDRPFSLALLRPLILYPGSSRSPGGSTDLILPSQVAMVRLQLALESDDYPHYDAVVRKGVDGPVAFKGTKLKAAPSRSIKLLNLRFPSTRLSPGEYIVNVDGVNPPNGPQFIATYSFRAIANK